MSDTGLKWLPVISGYCMGCGRCVDACPHGCLDLDWDFARLRRPEACLSGGDCAAVCPEDKALRMAWVETPGNRDVGRWRKAQATSRAR